MKDVYADDIGCQWCPATNGAVSGSEPRGAVADRPGDPPTWDRSASSTRVRPPSEPAARLTPAADPDITAVNAAFALALCERHDLVGSDHRLYDLAHAAADDAVCRSTVQARFAHARPSQMSPSSGRRSST